MKKPAKIMRSEAREINGETCFILIGKDGIGRPVEMALPEKGLNILFAEAERRINAFKAQKNRETIGGLTSVISSRGTPCSVEFLELAAEDAVALYVRKGEPAELVLHYSSADARGLGEELIRAADMIDNGTKPKPITN